MRIIVGLGNPGPRHERNRHNIGFMAADAIVRRHGFPAWRSKFQSEMVEGTIGGERVLVLKPQTYMNLSGEAVGAAARFYKVPPADVIVLHDELDLAPGKLRVKRGGGAAGHNGLRSIDGHIGQDYWRVRLGIGHPGVKELVHGYVLQNVPPDEARAWVEPLVDAVAEAMPLMVGGNEQLFMTRVAVILNPPDPNRQSKRPPSRAAGDGAKDG